MDGMPSRRELLAAASAVGLTTLSGCSMSESEPGTGTPSPSPSPDGSTAASTAPDSEGTDSGATEDDPPTDATPPAEVGLETLATGLRSPVDVAFAPAADRRYVADQAGRIHRHESGRLREDPFLDLGDAVTVGGERGLLGVALHPKFAENRRLFVRYSAPPRSGTPDNYSHTFVLAEFAATEDGTRVRPDSERTLLEIPEPQGNHNAGSLAFGPDGNLYVGTGDGGAGGDRGTGHVDDWYDANAGGNGQDTTENLLGGILRIDVDSEGDGDRPYAVPSDNPLVDAEGHLDEYYAWGLRNPWRFSFDGADFYVADVGQNRYEEVNLVERGGNYGWNVKEATHCFGANDCPDETPSDVRGGEPLVDPVIEYPHSGGGVTGRSVIGGHVYRGSSLPGLEGRYVFGDLAANGRLFTAAPSGGDGLWSVEVLPVADADAGKLGRILSFGRDPDGEVYVLATGSDGGGGVHRVVPAE